MENRVKNTDFALKETVSTAPETREGGWVGGGGHKIYLTPSP